MDDTNAAVKAKDPKFLSHPRVGAALMANRLCANWWVFVVRGVLALVFAGCVLFAGGMLPSPFLQAMALAAIVVMFAVYFFSSSVLDLVAFAEGAGGVKRGPFLVADAIVGLALCVLILKVPALEVHSLIYFLGAYAVVSGTLELRIAARTHTYFHTWMIATAGLSVAVLGATLLVLSVFGTEMGMQSIVNWIAGTAFYTGLVRIATGFYFRSWRGKLPSAESDS